MTTSSALRHRTGSTISGGQAAARDAVATFSQWQPVGVNLAVIARAWFWMDRAQLTYRDALILASAERLGCRWLLSEDFQDGRTYEGVTIVNPFRSQPTSSPR